VNLKHTRVSVCLFARKAVFQSETEVEDMGSPSFGRNAVSGLDFPLLPGEAILTAKQDNSKLLTLLQADQNSPVFLVSK